MRFTVSIVTAAGRDVVYDVVSDLATHRVWAGDHAPDKSFRLLSLDAPEGKATVGTRFTSTGANGNGTFHDASVVTEAAPYVFAFDTSSRLDRKHGEEWQVSFSHRYSVESTGVGSVLHYSCRVHDGSYVPYWLHPMARPLTRIFVQRLMTKNLRVLLRLAEERSAVTTR
jgi:hypothetical protein